MRCPKYFQAVGINYYSTNSPGIGGKIRQTIRDFIVEEISLDKKISFCLKKNKKIKLNKKAPIFRCGLEKHGLENLQAIKTLADALNISTLDIGFAGMKDKQALTSQFISIRRADFNEINNLNLKNIFLRNPHFSNSAIKIGDLFGNHFVITIRNLSNKKKVIKNNINTILNEIKENKGLINYFGMQRFGDIRPISHLVGKAILIGNYEQAIKIYLTKTFMNESSEAKSARTELKESWNFEKAIKFFPKHLIYERKMIQSLKKNPDDFKKALEILPKRLQSLLIYAFQSYIFNKILSWRKEQKPEFGDLRINDYVLILDNLGLPTHSGFFVSEKNFSHLKHLIEVNKAVIAAPLIGSETQIKNEFIKQLLNEEHIKLKDFNSKDPQLKRRGGYRPLLFFPMNFKIKKIVPDKDYLKYKVILDFSLKKGCYASVLLSEIIKNKISED